MWKAEVLNVPNDVCWLRDYCKGDVVDVADNQFNYWKKKGLLKGIKHYRLERTWKKCETCGSRIKVKEEVIEI